MSRLAWGVLIGGTFVSAVLLGFGLTLIWSVRRDRRRAALARPPLTPETPRQLLHCIRCQSGIYWPTTEPYPRACMVCKLPAAYTAGSAVRGIFAAGIERQARRLAAELDDPAAVERWLTGGTR